jgi:excisionase family DNA binding protein
MDNPQTDPIAVTIPNALRLSGLGRTKLYELIAKREIQTARVGSRRLVLVESLRRFLASQEA